MISITFPGSVYPAVMNLAQYHREAEDSPRLYDALIKAAGLRRLASVEAEAALTVAVDIETAIEVANHLTSNGAMIKAKGYSDPARKAEARRLSLAGATVKKQIIAIVKLRLF